MHNPKKKLAVLAMSAVAAAVVAGPVGTASAKTQKVTIAVTANELGSLSDISGTIKSKALGKGVQTKKSYLKLPISYNFWKFKGGTLAASGEGKLVGSTSSGKWKLRKGKSLGKFKGATGGGTFFSDLTTGVTTFKGTIKY